jgi:hypothetical protein
VVSAVPRSIPVEHDVLAVHCAGSSLSRQPSQVKLCSGQFMLYIVPGNRGTIFMKLAGRFWLN